VRGLFTRLECRGVLVVTAGGIGVRGTKEKGARNKNEDADYFACEGPLSASSLQASLRDTNAPDTP
jgi:hypothetical protein